MSDCGLCPDCGRQMEVEKLIVCPECTVPLKKGEPTYGALEEGNDKLHAEVQLHAAKADALREEARDANLQVDELRRILKRTFSSCEGHFEDDTDPDMTLDITLSWGECKEALDMLKTNEKGKEPITLSFCDSCKVSYDPATSHECRHFMGSKPGDTK